jgi:hypothetical protein
VLDFRTRNLSAPMYPLDPGPYASFCAPAGLNKWEVLREIAGGLGFLSS